ncbi:MAG TPA: hypothetical protein VGB16_05520 [candidate division Zixibacteria bacterium]
MPDLSSHFRVAIVLILHILASWLIVKTGSWLENKVLTKKSEFYIIDLITKDTIATNRK